MLLAAARMGLGQTGLVPLGVLGGTGTTGNFSTIQAPAGSDLTLSAGSGNQNVSLVPSGSGSVLISGPVGGANIQTAGNYALKLTTSTAQTIVIVPGGTTQVQFTPGGNSIFGANASDAGSFKGFIQVIGSINTQTTAGPWYAFSVTPTYNQTSGNASNTDIFLNRTQTSVGSGAQLLIDLQVGGASKFNTDNSGSGVFAGSLSVGGNYYTPGQVTTANGSNGMVLSVTNTVSFKSNNVTALTLSSAQNATFAGTVQAIGYLSSDGTAGMTLASTTTLGKSITIKNGLVVAFA